MKRFFLLAIVLPALFCQPDIANAENGAPSAECKALAGQFAANDAIFEEFKASGNIAVFKGFEILCPPAAGIRVSWPTEFPTNGFYRKVASLGAILIEGKPKPDTETAILSQVKSCVDQSLRKSENIMVDQKRWHIQCYTSELGTSAEVWQQFH